MSPRDPRETTPKKIEALGVERSLRVLWADDHDSRIRLLDLRRACPCATCQHERAEGAATTAAATPRTSQSGSSLRIVRGPAVDQLEIARVVPVGRYAVQLVWKDGHDTGIYSFELLRSLCSCPRCTQSPEQHSD